ncbi:MAG: tetratricopeptide repeat protein [Pseudomonadota bacterium]
MGDGTLESGWSFLAAGNTASAMRAAKELLGEDPRSGDALELLSMCYLADGAIAKAQDEAENWLRLEPDNANAHLNNVRILLNTHFQDHTRQLIETFKQSFPNHPHEYELMLGRWELYYGSTQRSVELLSGLDQTFPNDWELNATLAVAEYENRRIFRAHEYARNALAQRPDNPRLLSIFAKTSFRLFQFRNARDAAKAARRYDPSQKLAVTHIPASWAVFFPPFLLGHGLQYGASWLAERLPYQIRLAPLLLLFALTFIVIALRPSTVDYDFRAALPTFAGILAMFWALMSYAGMDVVLWDDESSDNVNLRDY